MEDNQIPHFSRLHRKLLNLNIVCRFYPHKSNKSHCLNPSIFKNQAGIFKWMLLEAWCFSDVQSHSCIATGRAILPWTSILRVQEQCLHGQKKSHVFTQMFQAFSTFLPLLSCSAILCAEGHIHFILVSPLILK